MKAAIERLEAIKSYAEDHDDEFVPEACDEAIGHVRDLEAERKRLISDANEVTKLLGDRCEAAERRLAESEKWRQINGERAIWLETQWREASRLGNEDRMKLKDAERRLAESEKWRQINGERAIWLETQWREASRLGNEDRMKLKDAERRLAEARAVLADGQVGKAWSILNNG